MINKKFDCTAYNGLHSVQFLKNISIDERKK